MSKDYFALYDSPNIVIVPTVISTNKKKSHAIDSSGAITESSTSQQIDTEEPKTQSELLFVSDRHVPTSVGVNNNCVDISKHFDNLKNLPLKTSTQQEVKVSYSKYSSHNNLVDLTTSSNLNTNKTTLKLISDVNLNHIIDNCEDKKPTEIEEKEWEPTISRAQNNLMTETHLNTVNNNNMNPITESNNTEKKLKYMGKHEKSSTEKKVSQSPKKRSYHESNTGSSRNQENEKESGSKQRKVLKTVSIKKKHETDQGSIHTKPEYDSKHSLNTTKSTNILQKCEHKRRSPNNEFLHTTLTDSQKNNLTAGALKRYLDYQRFLSKYYNKNQSSEEKNTTKCNTIMDSNNLKLKNEKNKMVSTVELKDKALNVKTNIELNKNSSRVSDISPNIERKPHKKSKRECYHDKKESTEQSTNRSERKNKKENEKSTTRLEKKEELKIKFTSYCQKRKKKSIENNSDKNIIETDKGFAQCSERSKKKRKHDGEIIDSPKHKVHKEKSIRKSYDNSDIKKMKEETNGKVNETKESIRKRKITSSEQESTKQYYKHNSATVVGSSQNNPDIESYTLPKRTVDVIEKSSCYNIQNSCKERKHLRSKLIRKSSKNQCDTESTRNKLTPTRENLIVTVKQDVPTTVPSSDYVQSVNKKEGKKSKVKKHIQSSSKKEVVKKHKVKKSKKLKLVINIKCPNSDDSDEIASESSTSPHQDLSFLDDLDIDGIVDSLNAGQSPIRDSNKGDEKETTNICGNNFNVGTKPLEKDCSPAALQEADLLCILEDSKEGVIGNANKLPLSASHTNDKNVEECDDDVYEVIDIVTDESEHEDSESIVDITEGASIIYINDDSRDETELLNKSKDENKVAVTSENVENIQNVITEVNKQNETNITSLMDNETELPEVKYSFAQRASLESASTEDAVKVKYSKQEFSKIEDSTIKNDSHSEGDETLDNNCIKSENLEVPQSISTSDTNVRERMPNDTDDSLRTIKNEKTDEIIVKTEDIEKSQKLLTLSSNKQDHVNNDIGNTMVNIKTEAIGNLETPQNVAFSDSNGQISNGVDTTLIKIKKEQIAAIVKTEDIEKSQNDLTTSSNILKHNTAITTKAESIANMQTAVAIKSESSSDPVQPNIDLKNDDINLAKVMITEDVKIIKETSVMKISEDKSVLVKPNSSEQERNPNEDSAKITTNKNKSKDSDDLEVNRKKQVNPGEVIIPKSVLTTSSNIDHVYNGVDNSALNTIPEPVASVHTAIIETDRSSVPAQPNIGSKNDDIYLPKGMMTAENVDINKESSSVMTTSNNKAVLTKPISTSSKYDENTDKSTAEITSANKNKPKNSDKFEAKNTKKPVNPGDVIIPKSKNEKINPVTENANLKDNIVNMYTADKRETNITKLLNKKIPKKAKQTKSEVEVVTTAKSETKANIADWSKIEQRMFEYLRKKFTVTKTIHTGYFSSIYKCADVNGGTFAIKVLKARFQSMAIYKDKMLSNLHKSTERDQYFLLEIINNFNIHGEWCFMTEYYPKTLAEFLAQGSQKKPKCFHIDVVQNLSRQLVAAVCTLTQNQLVHSDIKPAHILLDSSHTRLRLCGFDRMDYNYNLKIIPSTGTASYRAPEIIMGFKADYKIDVWSTALVMFEMASGFKLFPGGFNNDILFKQITTLGPVSDDMIKNSTHAFKYFYGTRFMKQIGTSEFIYVNFLNENFRIHKGPYTSYQKIWAKKRSHLQVTEDLDKIEMLHRLLQIMLVIDPRHRIPITYVAANEFIYQNTNNISY